MTFEPQASTISLIFSASPEMIPVKTWTGEDASRRGAALGLENRYHYHEIPQVEDALTLLAPYPPDLVGYWHDVGHAQVKEQFGLLRQESVLERFRGKTLGMHLQDFAPPARDHVAPGQGTFDFARLAPFVTGDMVLAWEIHREWKPEQIMNGAKRAHELLGRP